MSNGEHVISLGLSRRLAELLVEERVITSAQLKEALESQREKSEKLGTILISKGFVTEERILQFLSAQCDISYITLSGMAEIAPEVIALVPETIARQHTLIPFNKTNNSITIAVADPLNVLILDDLKMMTGCDVKAALASETEILAALDKYYKPVSSQDALDDIVKQSQTSEDAADAVEVRPGARRRSRARWPAG